MKNIILTGDRPTGRLHLGHYVGSLKRRVELQNSGRFDEINILIADDQALTDNADNPGKIRENIINVVLDYLSVGIDPTKSGNVVYQLQQARNEYARRLHEAEQQRIFAEQQRKRIEQATARLTSDINDYICAEFNAYVESAISVIESLEQ